MAVKSIKVNAILNGFRNLLNVVFPLITFPYVSRVLSVDGLGRYSFSYTFVNYFVLIASLGINNYAIREGSRKRNDKEQISKFCSQIFSLNMFATVVAYVLLFACLFLLPALNKYEVCILIFSISMFFTTLGTDWLYTIYEDFAFVAARTVIFKLVSLVLLVLFVRHENQYLVYAGITVFSSVGASLLNFIYARRLCRIRFTIHIDIRKHFRSVIILFAYSIAVALFGNIGMTMLGFLRGTYTVGIFSVSVKIYEAVKTVLSAVLMVSVPRLSMYLGNKLFTEYRELLSKVFKMLILFTIPTMIGILSISTDVAVLLSGQRYARAGQSLAILSVALLFSVFGWFYNECMLIPARKELIVLCSTFLGAVASMGLNYLFIPKWNENAAAFATVVAEFIQMIIGILIGRSIARLQDVRRHLIQVLVACVPIIPLALIIHQFVGSLFLRIVLTVVSSVFAYLGILLALRNDMVLEELASVRARLRIG